MNRRETLGIMDNVIHVPPTMRIRLWLAVTAFHLRARSHGNRLEPRGGRHETGPFPEPCLAAASELPVSMLGNVPCFVVHCCDSLETALQLTLQHLRRTPLVAAFPWRRAAISTIL